MTQRGRSAHARSSPILNTFLYPAKRLLFWTTTVSTTWFRGMCMWTAPLGCWRSNSTSARSSSLTREARYRPKTCARRGRPYGGQDDKIEDVRSLIEKYPKADLTVGGRSGPSGSPDSAGESSVR